MRRIVNNNNSYKCLLFLFLVITVTKKQLKNVITEITVKILKIPTIIPILYLFISNYLIKKIFTFPF